MSTKNRRLSRLEKLATLTIAERKRREPERAARQHQAALNHAAKLVALILHGNPHTDEPLAIAWERALSNLGLSDTPQAILPYRLRGVVAALPGDTEIDKVARVLCSAPRWLLDFCDASLDCVVLGIGLPKRSEAAPKYGRGGLRDSFYAWPGLPTGTIAAGPAMTEPNPMRVLSPDETIDLIELLEKRKENWSRRDRLRHKEIMDKVDRDELSRALTR